MTKRHQVYKCNICGNIVEVLHEGGGTLVCCAQDMVLFEEKKEEEGNEKHLPVVKVEGNKVIVEVGSVPHPMEDVHYIEWIEVINGEESQKVFLKPGQEPKVEFTFENIGQLRVREYCNLHGLWETVV
jgi:superoxide reductase